MNDKDWVVYLIRCSDGSLYCGITNNLQKRLKEHDSGKGAKYTRSRRPVELVAASSKMSKSDALKFEYRVKQLPSGKKDIQLIEGEEEAMKIKKELDKVSKEMQTITRMLAKLVVDADQLQKAKPKASKTKAVKKAPAKKSTVRTAAKTSAADTVLGIIKKSKKGIDTGTLMQKTGYDKKKIYNIVFKLKKLSKIKSAEKGLYLLA